MKPKTIALCKSLNALVINMDANKPEWVVAYRQSVDTHVWKSRETNNVISPTHCLPIPEQPAWEKDKMDVFRAIWFFEAHGFKYIRDFDEPTVHKKQLSFHHPFKNHVITLTSGRVIQIADKYLNFNQFGLIPLQDYF